MIPLVIDAHLIKAYSEEDGIGSVPSCTGPMSSIIKHLGRSSVGFLDAGGMIEQEWRNVTEPEWFVAWFTAALDAGVLELIDVVTRPELIKKLITKAGFPGHTKDRWYIFTSVAVLKTGASSVVLLSEDLHFYEPSARGCASSRRLKLLEQEDGKVAQLLRAEKIQVRPVASHLRAVA